MNATSSVRERCHGYPLRIFSVHIDMELLRSHLSREEGRNVPKEEVEDWLTNAGFTRIDDRWTVREADLGQLDPSEVTSAEIVDDTST
jgi:hypothetical protein